MKPKRVVSLLVAGCMAVSMVPASAVTAFAETVGNSAAVAVLANAETSGDCGAEGYERDVHWAFDSTTGVLSITGTGTGRMADYNSANPPEWKQRFSNQIKEVRIGEGVTYIGDAAFNNMTALVKVNIPASITGFGWYIFAGDTSLTTVDWADNFEAPEITERECEKDTNGNDVAQGKYVPNALFDGCTSLGQGVELTKWLPKSFTGVACASFRGTQFSIDFDNWNNLTYIGAYAFYGMPHLDSFRVTDKIKFGTYKGNNSSNAFSKSSLKSVEFDVANNISLSPFGNCALEQFDVAGKTVDLPGYIWQGNETLKKVDINAQNCTVHAGAFCRANALQTACLKADNYFEKYIFCIVQKLEGN